MTVALDQKRFAAILVMDVVGYSQLIEADELGTVRAVRSLRNRIILPALEASGGRLVKTMGDGFLAEFGTADAAMTSALEIQNACVEQARAAPADRRLFLRMGAHIGNVIIEGEDILGDGVNIAARLEGLAHPSGIAASSEFAHALQKGLVAHLDQDGQHTVKNISRSLTVWRWAADRELQHTEPNQSFSPPTVAVLAFLDHAPDPDQSFFAEGLAEDIISALQHMGRLPVIASASSLIIDPALSPQDAARVLGARYLVKGTVRRAGKRIRVTVELIEGDTGHSLWSEKYDRDFKDLFGIQDDITLRVVTALDVELVEGEIDRLRQQRPRHLGAWELYLRGMANLRNAALQDLKEAQRDFCAAIDIEPDYGEAWAALGWAYLKEYGFGLSKNRDTALENGFDAARKALSLSKKSPFAHYVMSTAYVWRGEKELSLNELEHAIRLNPYFTRAKVAYHNRKELADPSQGLEAAEEIRKALALSPREPDRAFYFWSIARINLVAGEAFDALDWADRAVSTRPTDANMVYRRAICLAALDRVDDASKALVTCEQLSPGSVARLSKWCPYEDERDDILFSGLVRHGLIDRS